MGGEVTRSEFIARERRALLDWMADAPPLTSACAVTYTCDCGHVSHTPGDAWDHAQTHRQQTLFGSHFGGVA